MGGGYTVPRFFIEKGILSGDSVSICGEDARHISFSLRAKPGEEYVLCDDEGYEYQCVIESIDSERVNFRVVGKIKSDREPDVSVTLYQALTKSDKFDSIIQKAVELGVRKIVPVLTSRCVSRPDGKALLKKNERWQKIAKTAAMQSMRGIVPYVSDTVDYETAISEIACADCGFVCYETEPHRALSEILKEASLDRRAESYAFLVGPEGGISEKEADYAKSNGVALASLGKRILRTETAPVCVISSVMFFTGNLD